MFEGNMLNSVETMHVINGAHDEIIRVEPPMRSAASDRQATRWIAPEVRVVRLNCDASWCNQMWHGGKGVVARNATGQVMEGLNRRTYCSNIEGLEGQAILEDIKLAIEKGWQNLEVEMNPQIVIE